MKAKIKVLTCLAILALFTIPAVQSSQLALSTIPAVQTVSADDPDYEFEIKLHGDVIKGGDNANHDLYVTDTDPTLEFVCGKYIDYIVLQAEALIGFGDGYKAGDAQLQPGETIHLKDLFGGILQSGDYRIKYKAYTVLGKTLPQGNEWASLVEFDNGDRWDTAFNDGYCLGVDIDDPIIHYFKVSHIGLFHIKISTWIWEAPSGIDRVKLFVNGEEYDVVRFNDKPEEAKLSWDISGLDALSYKSAKIEVSDWAGHTATDDPVDSISKSVIRPSIMIIQLLFERFPLLAQLF